MGPLSDTIPTGQIVLGMNASDVEGIPSRSLKVFNSDKFEKTYETAFGKFSMTISAGEIKQTFSKPGKVTTVLENTEQIVWKIVAQDYVLQIVRTSDSVTQTCTTPDGELTMKKQKGEVTENFVGVNQDHVLEVCAQAETDLQEEVNKIEEIAQKSIIPETETKTSTSTKKVLINEFMADPENESFEWIELYNPTKANITLEGWAIEDDSGDRQSLSGRIIQAGGYLVLNKTNGDFKFSMTNTKDILILRQDGKIVDQVVYGDYNDGNIEDNAPKAPENSSLARIPNGQDTNVDKNDFKVDSTPTPNQENSL